MKSITYILSLVLIVGTATALNGQSPEEIKGDQEITRMHTLIVESKYQQLAKFIDQGANVNAVDEVGNSALHYAAKIGDRQTIDLLIRKGAVVDQSNITGTTPLMMAAKYGNSYTVKKLLEHGANPKIKNNSGFTAYTYAMGFERQEVAEILKSRM